MEKWNKKYTVDLILIIVLFAVMFLPYFVLSTSVFGLVQSDSTLTEIDTYTKELTPLVIGLLCGVLVYRVIKRAKAER